MQPESLPFQRSVEDEKRPSVPPQRMTWMPKSPEHAAEKSYARTVKRLGDFRGGYLNPGLWKETRYGYIRAAEALVHLVCATARVTSKSEVLDVACGTGTGILSIADKFAPKKIVGLDVSWPIVEIAWRKTAHHRAAGAVEIRHGTATRLPWAGPNFSHVVCVDGSRHFPSRERFFREAQRVLRPGGVLCLTDFLFVRQPATFAERMLVRVAGDLLPLDREAREDEETCRLKAMSSGYKNVTVRSIAADVLQGAENDLSRPDTFKALSRALGWFAAYGLLLARRALVSLHRRGVIDYAIIVAQR
jgi:SAM-dependent methyltransferase